MRNRKKSLFKEPQKEPLKSSKEFEYKQDREIKDDLQKSKLC